MCTPRRMTRPRPAPRRRRPTTRTIPASASKDASQAQATVVRRGSGAGGCHRHGTASDESYVLHAYERSAETTISTTTTNRPSRTRWLADVVRPAVSPAPPAVLVPVAVASQPQPAPRRITATAADGNVRADVAGKLAVGTEASRETSRADRARVRARAGERSKRTAGSSRSGRVGCHGRPIRAASRSFAGPRRRARRCTRWSAAFQPHVAVRSSSHDSLRTGRAGASVNAGRRRSVRLEGTDSLHVRLRTGTGTCSYGPGAAAAVRR